MNAKRPTTVPAYIAAAPAAAWPMLRQLRTMIRSAAPHATEKISYRMPYYDWHGRLAYFAAFRRHVSFFVMGRVQQSLAAELAPWRSGRATLQFPIGSKLPVALLRRILRARLAELREKSKK